MLAIPNDMSLSLKGRDFEIEILWGLLEFSQIAAIAHNLAELEQTSQNFKLKISSFQT